MLSILPLFAVAIVFLSFELTVEVGQPVAVREGVPGRRVGGGTR